MRDENQPAPHDVTPSMNKISSLLAAGALVAAASLLVPSTAPVASAAATATVPGCRNADLHARYRATDNGAGHAYGRIVLTNVARHACRTGGFGGLSYVGGGNGTQVGAPASRDGRSAGSFVLRPGQRAISRVDEVRAANYDAATCRPRRVDGFRIYVPNATRSQFVAHRTTGCANPSVHLTSHTAYRTAG
ncbi:DUF4232 domain-containing protein [Nocardioides sp. LML1-1-1.1]|uniref:DUF4232 domain-containing protein n=1 Tax=Nocardioides sp. LML1-1-1.1 TaxID=3135248 RepID=UPI003432E7FD